MSNKLCTFRLSQEHNMTGWCN